MYHLGILNIQGHRFSIDATAITQTLSILDGLLDRVLHPSFVVPKRVLPAAS